MENLHNYKKQGQPTGAKKPSTEVIEDRSGCKTVYPTDYCSQVTGVPCDEIYKSESVLE